MNRRTRTEQKMQELFHQQSIQNIDIENEFMQIATKYIYGDLYYAGSLNNRTRELITITALTTLNTLSQLKTHIIASINVGCTPIEVQESIFQCAPFIGIPKTMNAIQVMYEAFYEVGIELPLPSQTTVKNDNDRYKKGLEIQAPIYGTEIANRYTWLPNDFSKIVPRLLTEFCFGDFFTRKGLDGKTRELLTVIMLATLGGAEVQVKSHVEGALKVGNTKEEIVCSLVHASAYIGIPRLFNTLNTCKSLFETI